MMKRYLLVYLCIAFMACGTPSGLDAIHNDSSSAEHSTSSYIDSSFSKNVVAQIGSDINEIFQDSRNIYWFASNSVGVFCYDGQSIFQFTTKDGLPDNQVFSVEQDGQGDIWMITVGGLSHFDGKKFKSLPSLEQQLLSATVSSEMSADDSWFPFAGGAFRYSGNELAYLLLPKPNKKTIEENSTDPLHPNARNLNAYSVYCSMKDSKGRIWLGTQTMGVCRFDGNEFKWFTEKGLAGPAVRAIFEDSKGDVWFGNNGGGLFRYHNNQLTNFTDEQGLGNSDFLKDGSSKSGTIARVWSIQEDNSGGLWIGTYDSGVWLFDGLKLTNFTTLNGLSSNAINTICKDNRGELWFGTDGGGACKYNGRSFTKFKP